MWSRRIPTLAARGRLPPEEDSGTTQRYSRTTRALRACPISGRPRLRLEVRVPNRRVIFFNKALLNSENSLSNATREWTGIEYVYWQLPPHLMRSPVTFTFVTIRISTASGLMLSNQFLLNELALSTGARLVLAKAIVLGRKRVPMLTVKIHAPNFGVATQVKNMLLSMNFVELLTSHTCYVSQTNIRSVWKPRVRQDLSQLIRFG